MSNDVAERKGFVYAVVRDDLALCYVGQSVNEIRPQMHLRPGNYRYDALCVEPVDPEVIKLEVDVLQGEALDAAERKWMREMVERSYDLVNRLGPDDVWPYVPHEYIIAGAKKGGAAGGRKGGRATAARLLTDAEFAERMRASARAGALQMWDNLRKDEDQLRRRNSKISAATVARNRADAVKRKSDSEYDSLRAAELARAGKKGCSSRTAMLAADPTRAAEWRAKLSASSIRAAKLKRLCTDCSFGPVAPGPMGAHLKKTGHSGYSQLNTKEK